MFLKISQSLSIQFLVIQAKQQIKNVLFVFIAIFCNNLKVIHEIGRVKSSKGPRTTL